MSRSLVSRSVVAASLPGWVRCSPSFFGWVYWSVERPVALRSSAVLGGVAFCLRGPGGASFRLGSALCRARCYRLCIVPPSGAARLRWLVWCGRGRAPSKAAVVAWFASRGALSGWRVLPA